MIPSSRKIDSGIARPFSAGMAYRGVSLVDICLQGRSQADFGLDITISQYARSFPGHEPDTISHEIISFFNGIIPISYEIISFFYEIIPISYEVKTVSDAETSSF